MSSAICFNLDQSKILSSGNGLRNQTKAEHLQNGTGSKKDSTGGCQTKLYDEQDIRCVAIGQSLREMSCTYGLAVHKKVCMSILYLSTAQISMQYHP